MSLRNAWSLQLPPLNDFVLSPAFGGGLVLLAALIVLLVATRHEARRLDKQLGQQDRHHQEVRGDRQRRDAIERCWQRLVWLVKTANTEPADIGTDEAVLGLGPGLTLAILEGLTRDAKELQDGTLAEAVAAYFSQYGLALGQKIGSLPDISEMSDKGQEHVETTGDSKAARPVAGATHATARSGAHGGREL